MFVSSFSSVPARSLRFKNRVPYSSHAAMYSVRYGNFLCLHVVRFNCNEARLYPICFRVVKGK